MGELSVSSSPEDVLASIGLGSCIGLVLMDRARGCAGLAHIVLPSSGGASVTTAGKFADLAVPALVERLLSLGASRTRMHALLVGGAQMFASGPTSTLDIGRRNEQATREALASAGLPVRAAATGGQEGRTVRVYVGQGVVTVKGPGRPEDELVAASTTAEARK